MLHDKSLGMFGSNKVTESSSSRKDKLFAKKYFKVLKVFRQNPKKLFFSLCRSSQYAEKQYLRIRMLCN